MIDGYLLAFAFIWGAVWGSFLNVVIYRLPEDLSVVRPGSRCGHCGTAIRWFDNIPIVSYLILRGRCRDCGTGYSPRYMLVEAACGALSMALMQDAAVPFNPETFQADLLLWLWLLWFALALVAIAFIDLDHFFIPWEISYPSIVVGLAGAFLLPEVDGMSRLYGALGGAGFLLMVYGLGWLIFRREALGLGDLVLLAMIGSFLGWRELPLVVLAAAVQALLAVAANRVWEQLRGEKTGFTKTAEELDEHFGEEVDMSEWVAERAAVPFGPFLALAALEVLLFGSLWFWQGINGVSTWLVERMLA
jgi:leader peptidase (prepilin peptidase)/N-methyltransferase